MLAVFMVAALLLAGCSSFWEDQGTASRLSAEARRVSALAAQRDAEAAIIDAEARGSLAESQAHALRTTIDANADLTRQAVSMADDGEYVWVFAAIAFAVLAFAGLVIWAMARRPAPAPPPVERHQPRQWLTIETSSGLVRMIQEPHETQQEFTLRVALLAARLSEAETAGRLLEGPRR
jgi:hypothetical protein